MTDGSSLDKLIDEYIMLRLFGDGNDTSRWTKQIRIIDGMLRNRKCIFLNSSYFGNGSESFDKIFKNKLCQMYFKWNFKCVTIPCFEWNGLLERVMSIASGYVRNNMSQEGISNDIVSTIARFYSFAMFDEENKGKQKLIVSDDLTVNINHLGVGDAIYFRAYLCGDYFELKVVDYPLDIKYIEYEYELYIESIPFYKVCSFRDSHDKQYFVDQTKEKFYSAEMNSESKINIAIRVLKCLT